MYRVERLRRTWLTGAGSSQARIRLAGLSVLALAALAQPMAAGSAPAREAPSLREQAAARLVAHAEQRGEQASRDDAKITVTRRSGAEWAFGAAVMKARRTSGAYPYGWLFIAHRDREARDGGEPRWRVAFEDEARFADLAADAPMMTPGERELLTAERAESAGDKRTGMRLPFAVGQTWSYTGGPHRMGNSVLSSIDLAGGDLKVRAARAGKAYTMCKGWIRVVHDRGYSTDYYHLWNQISVDGTAVPAGKFLGDAGTDVTCGGGATGRHVHFSLRQHGEYQPINGYGFGKWVIREGGKPYDGYALHGSSRANVGGRVTNYGALASNQGVVDTDGGGTLRRRSGPGTDHDILGELADGATVAIECSANGTEHVGRDGASKVWHKLSDGAWVSGAYVWTGTADPVKGWC
ncbi:MAG: peptidoglycan DD-metalloendopeptidase family protein [Micromonosporaceae bacterium]|nr:peptidoglycan DD-metalloendopeptidase family protein [Micromonosporaceae bacterium]